MATCGAAARGGDVNRAYNQAMRFAIVCLAFAVPAFAQLDSPSLRARYGPPLDREIFHIPAGFDLTVDYGASRQVCKLQVPAWMPAQGSGGVDPKKQMYDFLDGLVPESARGKELNRMMQQLGLVSVTSVDYEHATIVEMYVPNQPSADTIAVTFKRSECQTITGQ